MFIGYSEAELSRLLCAASISFPFFSFWKESLHLLPNENRIADDAM
jgi:hypothetical protein